MRFAALTLVVLATTAHAAPALVFQSDPYPGIHREIWVESGDFPARIHLIRIDLTSAEIAVYATKESDSGIRTTEFSDLLNAQVAINGGPFQVSGFLPRGLTMGDSAAWTSTADTDQMAVLHFRREGERTFATIVPPATPVDMTTLPLGTQGVISGRPLLVNNGNLVTNTLDCSDTLTFPCMRGPRTAVALSADGNTMWLAVVNGWQAASHGLSLLDLAAFLQARGAYKAIALDGGASSTLVVNGALANTPSDGVERTVANHLGIKYGFLPKGEMRGYLCITPDIPACGLDPALRVDARVTLDDKRFVNTTNGFFAFASITPRTACVTVKKTGYLTRVQCKSVQSGIATYNSVYMEEGSDPPDAGVRDAGGEEEFDAGVTGDAGMRPDGGFTGGGGGCCDARGDLGGAGTSVLVGALVAWRTRRRRGTKA